MPRSHPSSFSMVAKGVFTGTKRVKTPSVAFGDFPATPVVLPTKKLSLSGDGNEEQEAPRVKATKDKDSRLSGGNGADSDPIPSFYVRNQHARSSVQARRPEAGMTPAQLLELKAMELAIRRVELAVQEQRNVGIRLEIEREKDRRRAAEHEQQKQQNPEFWDAAHERQLLRVEEA